MNLDDVHAAWLTARRSDLRAVPAVVIRPWGWSLRFDLRLHYPKAWGAFQLSEDDPGLAFARTSWDDREARAAAAASGVGQFGEVWSCAEEGYLPVYGASYGEALAELARALKVAP